jgi:hypothetical protein
MDSFEELHDEWSRVRRYRVFCEKVMKDIVKNIR